MATSRSTTAEKSEDPKVTNTSTDDDTTDDDDLSISQPASSNLLPLTAPDAQGINRVVVGSDDGWEPAETDPDPKLVKRNEKRVKELKEAQDERQKALRTREEKSGAKRSDDASPLEP
ncbi:MAG TPA: hypothetical protein VIT65_22415 [Microlunatus sp.]